MKLYLIFTGYKVKNLTGFSSLDPTKTSDEFLKQKVFELRSFAPDAAVFTSVVQPGSREITADEKDVDVNPLPEPLTSLFDPSLVNENEVDIRRISKLRYDSYVKMYGPCHYTNLLNITKLQSSNTVWKLERGE